MLKFFSSNRFKSREFGYKPRFYDPDKEALEKRIKIRQAKVNDHEMRKMRLRQEFSYLKHQEASKKVKTSSLRLLVIIIILGAASYLVLDRLLPDLLESWFGTPESYEMLDEYDLD